MTRDRQACGDKFSLITASINSLVSMYTNHSIIFRDGANHSPIFLSRVSAHVCANHPLAPFIHDNTLLHDRRNIMLAILPSCLYYIEGFAIDDSRPHGDRDDE